MPKAAGDRSREYLVVESVPHVEVAGEPSLPGPEPGVLPLDYSPVSDVTESKSSPFPGLLSDILPSNLPKKPAAD